MGNEENRHLSFSLLRLMTYAFTFDASACSGCKACQVACKDKNNLPAGALWRRVYEVSGGTWQKHGHAWVTDVFAYTLSIACNHCVHPKCAGVCPADAYVTRQDGIVYIDETKCIGCGYCNWACPYAAPQFNPERGTMGKCNFCFDNIDAGLPPSCVAACPLRVLDFIDVDSEVIPEASDPLWQTPASAHPFPLPQFSRTEPHLAIKRHAGMGNALEKVVLNGEEARPGSGTARAPSKELPLVAFTLLGQIAAGLAVFSLFSGPLSTPVLIALGSLIAFAGLASFSHLGTPGNAWRAVMHLRKSWLSREILAFILFGLCWIIALILPGMGKLPLAACGIALVYSMAQVYRLRSIAAWNSYRTLLSFSLSALLLGGLGWYALSLMTATKNNVYLLSVLTIALGVAGWVTFTEPVFARQAAGRLRLGLIGLGLFGMLVLFISPSAASRWVVLPIFLAVLIEEGIGRQRFYEHLQRRVL